MWYHLQCLRTLLRDGLEKSSRAVTSFVKETYRATFEWVLPLIVEVVALVALLTVTAATIFLPLLACVWLWQQITN